MVAGSWGLSLYPEAGEAGGSWRGSGGSGGGGGGSDPERSAAEAARRARGKVRRYCAANGLNRLGTLTWAGEGEHDPVVVRGEIRRFFKGLRRGLGGEAFPYLWVPELHKSHGWHVHFVVNRFVRKRLIDDVWGLGFSHIKLIGNLPVGSGVRAEARVAAGYVSKYLGKGMGSGAGGLNRYDCAEGFQPRSEPVVASTVEAAIDAASARMGERPAYVWRSEVEDGWQGPPAVWLQWR